MGIQNLRLTGAGQEQADSGARPQDQETGAEIPSRRTASYEQLVKDTISGSRSQLEKLGRHLAERHRRQSTTVDHAPESGTEERVDWTLRQLERLVAEDEIGGRRRPGPAAAKRRPSSAIAARNAEEFMTAPMAEGDCQGKVKAIVAFAIIRRQLEQSCSRYPRMRVPEPDGQRGDAPAGATLLRLAVLIMADLEEEETQEPASHLSILDAIEKNARQWTLPGHVTTTEPLNRRFL